MVPDGTDYGHELILQQRDCHIVSSNLLNNSHLRLLPFEWAKVCPSRLTYLNDKPLGGKGGVLGSKAKIEYDCSNICIK